MSEKEVLSGWFVYKAANGGWGDHFTIEDDDGMSFVLDALKQFHGRPVRITVELDATLEPDFGPTAIIFERLGLTAKNARAARDRQRGDLLKSENHDPR